MNHRQMQKLSKEDFNKVKNYLSQVYRCNVIIQNKNRHINNISNLLDYKSPLGNISDVHLTSPNNNKLHDMIVLICDIKDELVQDIITMENKKTEVSKYICQLQDPDELNILYLRYVFFDSFNNISKKTNYSLSTIFEKHNNGIYHIYGIIKKDNVI